MPKGTWENMKLSNEDKEMDRLERSLATEEGSQGPFDPNMFKKRYQKGIQMRPDEIRIFNSKKVYGE